MAEIGATLREARSRARIEIAQMEAQTKIRAKYLRALENEEWELLPGPTYVKSFLRTYGDMLGIDGRALVAEYKRTQETFTGPEDLGHFSKHTGGRMARTERPLRLYATLAATVVLVAAGAGWMLLGSGNGDDSATTTPALVVQTTPVAGKVINVQLAAQRAVTVCARAGERQLLSSTDLKAGERTPKLRGRRVLITVSSPDVVLRVDGDRVALPARTGTLTFTATEYGVTRENDATTACRG
ncbi:MAG: helix-turn-helix domain-containing protein [Patulibacter sp.]